MKRQGPLLRRQLRVRFAGLPPIRLVELFRTSPRDRQRSPPLTGMDAGNLDDLADVVAGVAQGAFQGQRHGMRLATDHHGLFAVFPLQAPNSLLKIGLTVMVF